MNRRDGELLEDEDSAPIERLGKLRELARSGDYPVGTRVVVEEDQITYICVGNSTPEIASMLGWSQRNVWMPEHVLHHIQARHPVIVDPLAVAAVALARPLGVHLDHAEPETKRIFYVDGEILRQADLLTSQTTQYVSAGVELRYTSGEILLRLFHLSPHRVTRGECLWP